MKILMINKFYYIKGGSETYYFALKDLLVRNGHEVIDFSMKDTRNFESKYSKYFIENIDYNKKQSLIDKIRVAAKIIYSFEAKNKLESLIKQTKPDIAHLHIFQHQISPSILDVLKKYNIPIVYTAHDLKMICPNYKMLSNGEICERCKGGRYINCIRYKCVKNSFVKSSINTIEAYFHKYKGSYEIIDKIITPSEFYRRKFIEFGVQENKIIHINNFLFENKCVNKKSVLNDKYIIYFGRLSEEKGIETLIRGIKNLNIDLYIVGTGPLKEKIEKYILENKISNIKVLGYKAGEELKELVSSSQAVVIPSEWYENGPYSAIESLSMKKPIIGSNLGGIPELIEPGYNGYIFEGKNEESLIEVIKKFLELDEAQRKIMGENSRNIFMKSYTENGHYKNIIAIYNSLLKNKS